MRNVEANYMNNWDPITSFILGVVVPVSSLAGLANLLRSEKTITYREIISAILNSGLFGLVIASWMIHTYGVDSRWLIVSTSVLAGLGGNALLDFTIQSIKTIWKGYIERESEKTQHPDS